MAATPTVFLLQAPLDAAFERVPRKNGIVPGCTTMVKQRDVLQHSINAASAHIVLQEEEVQLLQCLMHFQVRCLNYKNIKKKKKKKKDVI